ncbi:hypothetical protein AHF37_05628 [Paragonimus kellicotti]|nr:hypothetical protein AHF37_05628 [Paragonimus kellicotti]
MCRNSMGLLYLHRSSRTELVLMAAPVGNGNSLSHSEYSEKIIELVENTCSASVV